MQLSDELMAGLDARRAQEGRSRLELIREAVEACLHNDREAAIDQAIVAGDMRISADEVVAAERAARTTIAAEPGREPR